MSVAPPSELANAIANGCGRCCNPRKSAERVRIGAEGNGTAGVPPKKARGVVQLLGIRAEMDNGKSDSPFLVKIVTMKAGCPPMADCGTLVETREGDQTQGVARCGPKTEEGTSSPMKV
jgi:hypothetical protein